MTNMKFPVFLMNPLLLAKNRLFFLVSHILPPLVIYLLVPTTFGVKKKYFH